MSLLPRFARKVIRPFVNTPLSREYVSSTTGSSKSLTMDDVNELFAEARLSLQDALESKGTVYFEDDYKDAKKVTQETLQAFESLCASASEQERQSILEANRPKMAQLEQEFKSLEEELVHDE